MSIILTIKPFYYVGVTIPPHQRRTENEKTPTKKLSPKAQGVFSRVNSDIKALNSSILVISQKIKYLVRNEKILGRNLLVLNKKIKILSSRSQSSSDVDLSAITPKLDEISNKIDENSEAIAKLQSDVDNIKENYAKSEEVAEMKYIVDSINPLEFVSVKEVKDLIDGKKITAKKKK